MSKKRMRAAYHEAGHLAAWMDFAGRGPKWACVYRTEFEDGFVLPGDRYDEPPSAEDLSVFQLAGAVAERFYTGRWDWGAAYDDLRLLASDNGLEDKDQHAQLVALIPALKRVVKFTASSWGAIDMLAGELSRRVVIPGWLADELWARTHLNSVRSPVRPTPRLMAHMARWLVPHMRHAVRVESRAWCEKLEGGTA